MHPGPWSARPVRCRRDGCVKCGHRCGQEEWARGEIANYQTHYFVAKIGKACKYGGFESGGAGEQVGLAFHPAGGAARGDGLKFEPLQLCVCQAEPLQQHAIPYLCQDTREHRQRGSIRNDKACQAGPAALRNAPQPSVASEHRGAVALPHAQALWPFLVAACRPGPS